MLFMLTVCGSVFCAGASNRMSSMMLFAWVAAAESIFSTRVASDAAQHVKCNGSTSNIPRIWLLMPLRRIWDGNVRNSLPSEKNRKFLRLKINSFADHRDGAIPGEQNFFKSMIVFCCWVAGAFFIIIEEKELGDELYLAINGSSASNRSGSNGRPYIPNLHWIKVQFFNVLDLTNKRRLTVYATKMYTDWIACPFPL